MILPGTAILLGAILAFGQVAAGPGTRAPDSGEAVFTTETRLVALNVTVTDKSGHLVPNLPESAFRVFENNVVQPIAVFKHEDVPVSLALVVDSSGSMRSKQRG